MKQFIIFCVVCCSVFLNTSCALKIQDHHKSTTRIFLPLGQKTIRWTLQDIAPKHEGCVSFGQLLQKTINLRVINKCLATKLNTQLEHSFPIVDDTYLMWIKEAEIAISLGKSLESSAELELHEANIRVNESIPEDLQQTIPFRARVLRIALLNWKAEEENATQLKSRLEQMIKSDTKSDQ